MNPVRFILLACLLAITNNPAIAADKDLPVQQTDQQKFKAGRAKAQGCTRCHGGRGIERLAKSAKWTNSVGSFAQKELIAFREGTRAHNIMSAIAKNLSDQDIADIGFWLDAIAKK